jgi:hypothetical protein
MHQFNNTHNTLDAAKWYLEHGYFPVPVPYREKRPLLAEWPKLRLTAAELPRYFNAQPSNIGVLLGERGVADVDLDCAEALVAWPEFAPTRTLTFGRASSPASHFLYRAEPAVRFGKYLDEKNTLLELRGLKTNGAVGLQTIVPPSTHKETGERIAFEVDSAEDSAAVDGPSLSRAAASAAAAVLLARHFPSAKAGRNEAFLALAGLFAAEGWREDDALRFARAIYRVLWPGNPDFAAAGREVRSTYDRFRRDMGVIGMARLRTLIEPKVVEKFAGWLKLRHRQHGLGGVRLDPAAGFDENLRLLNSLSIWEGKIQFRGVGRRGSMLVAETTEGMDVVFPTVCDVIAFHKAQAVIAESTGFIIASPAKSLMRDYWEPVAQILLTAGEWARNASEPDLVEEFRELLRMTFERACAPTVNPETPQGFIDLLRMCGAYVRNPKGEPPLCCVWQAERSTWVHLPTLLTWLSTPVAINRQLEWGESKRALLLLGFKYRKDLHRSVEGQEAKASVWQGPPEVLGFPSSADPADNPSP